MASFDAVLAAVLKAAAAATIDRSKPEEEQVAFEAATLGRVVAFYKDAASQDLVIRAWHRAIHDAIAGRHDLDLALALGVLRDRLRASVGHSYEVTDGGPQPLPRSEPTLVEDPWLADRNYSG